MAGVCTLAALAPVIPSTVLTRGIWISLAILILRWRKVSQPDAFAIGLAAWATVTAIGLWSVPAANLAMSNYWSVCLLFIAVRCTVSTQREFVIAGGAYLAGCLFASVTIIQEGRKYAPGMDTSQVRLGVEGVNPNYTAYALAVGVVVVAGLVKAGGLPKKLRIILLATIPVISYATIWTGTRGAQVAIVTAVLYLLAAKFAPRAAWRVVIIGSPLLLVTVPLGLYGDSRLLWLQDFFARQGSDLSGRLDVWPMARATWGEHLWSGVGPGMFPFNNQMGIGAHSIVLSVGAELGIIGVALFATTMILGWVEAIRADTDGRELVGLLIVASVPIWLSGMWELSPAAWMVAALWSRLPSRHEPLSSG